MTSKTDSSQMGNAGAAYTSGEMSMRAAVKQFGVAQSTLSNRVHGIAGAKNGRPCRLSEFTETLYLKMLVTCNDIGFKCKFCDGPMNTQSMNSLNRKAVIGFVETVKLKLF